MCLQYLFSFIILTTSISISDATTPTPKEVLDVRIAINAVYKAMKEEQDELACRNNYTKEFNTKIDEYINIEKIMRNRTVKLNENFYEFITTAACDTSLKEIIVNTTNINEQINTCFENNIGLTFHSSSTKATKSNNAKGEEFTTANIVPYLFKLSYEIKHVDHDSEKAYAIMDFNNCLVKGMPDLNTTIQNLLPNIKEPVVIPPSSPAPPVQPSSGNTWIYILIAVIIAVGAALAAVIVFRIKKKQETFNFVDSTEFELKSTDHHPKI